MAPQKQTLKVKKKKWVSVIADKMFEGAPLGDTLSTEEGDLTGKSIRINLANLTGDIKQQNILLSFKIKELKEGKAIAGLKGYTVSGAAISRFVRRNIVRLDDSFLVKTKDDVILRLKPLTITRGRTTKARTNGLNVLVRSTMAELLSNMTYEQFAEGVITKKFQLSVKKTLSKIYPIKIFEVRSFRIATPSEIHKHSKSKRQTVVKDAVSESNEEAEQEAA